MTPGYFRLRAKLAYLDLPTKLPKTASAPQRPNRPSMPFSPLNMGEVEVCSVLSEDVVIDQEGPSVVHRLFGESVYRLDNAGYVVLRGHGGLDVPDIGLRFYKFGGDAVDFSVDPCDFRREIGLRAGKVPLRRGAVYVLGSHGMKVAFPG